MLSNGAKGFLKKALNDTNGPALSRLKSLKAAILHMLLVEETDGYLKFKKPQAETIQNLFNVIQEDPYAYDLVALLISDGLLREGTNRDTYLMEGVAVPIWATEGPPMELKIVAGLMLSGKLKRPKQNGTPPKFGRSVIYYTAMEYVVATYGLTATRAPTTRPAFSACDAVIKATRQLGRSSPSFVSMRSIWQNTHVREYLRHLRELNTLEMLEAK